MAVGTGMHAERSNGRLSRHQKELQMFSFYFLLPFNKKRKKKEPLRFYSHFKPFGIPRMRKAVRSSAAQGQLSGCI